MIKEGHDYFGKASKGVVLESWEKVAALGVNPELAISLNSHLDLSRRIGRPVSRLVVLALESVPRVALLALALLVHRIAHLLTRGHETALGDVLASRLHSVALLVLGRLAMPSALVRVGGGAVLALHHVGHAPGALKALGIPVAGEACGRSSVLELRDSGTTSLGLLALAPLFHGSAALNTAWLALGTVVPLQIKPTRLVGHRLGVLPLASCDCVFHELSLVNGVSRALWLRRLAWFFARLLSWLLSFAGLLLGGLHNHQEEQQQDHQLVPPHDVLRGGRERD